MADHPTQQPVSPVVPPPHGSTQPVTPPPHASNELPELSAADKLKAYVEDLPDSVPDTQILFGRASVSITLGDLRTITGVKSGVIVHKSVPGVNAPGPAPLHGSGITGQTPKQPKE
jgi:hypothetical protein